MSSCKLSFTFGTNRALRTPNKAGPRVSPQGGLEMKRFRICCLILFLFLTISCPAFPNCLPVQAADDEKVLKIDDAVLGAIRERGLKKSDFYHALQIVARYETNGCWSGAAGNSDNQWLSVGVMQWNLGQMTLQPLLQGNSPERPYSSAAFSNY